MLKVAPSILSADFADLGAEVRKVDEAGADWIHVDVMDGRFVPPITIGPLVAKAVRGQTERFMDCHLMVREPERHAEAFAEAGADGITIHAEATDHLHRAVGHLKDLGVQAGIALNPSTPESVLEYAIGEVDLVLCMTVNPGWGGQPFLPQVVSKVRRVARMAQAVEEEREKPLEIQVDGGINGETARLCERAGATVAVAGSFIYGADDVAQAIQAVRGTQRALVTE